MMIAFALQASGTLRVDSTHWRLLYEAGPGRATPEFLVLVPILMVIQGWRMFRGHGGMEGLASDPACPPPQQRPRQWTVHGP